MDMQKFFVTPFLLILLAIPSLSQASQEPSSSENQDQVKYHASMAQRYLGEQRPDLAIPELQAVVALDPTDTDALANLGVLQYFHGDYSDAIPQFRAALAQKSDLWKIQALLGLSEAKTGENQASRSDLASAFPQLDEKKFKLQVGDALIDNYAATGDMDQAAMIAATLNKLDPTNADVIYTSYRLYSDLADQAMVTMAMTAPKSAQLHQMMAHQLARRGDTAAAIANDREALKLNPNLLGIHYEIAEMLRASTDAAVQAQAGAEYRAALAQNPNDDMSILRLGEIAEKKGDLKEAKVDDERAIAIQPKNAEAYAELAKIYTSLDQPEQAKKALERSIQINPTSSVAHFRLSTIYRQEGKTAEARQQLALYMKYKTLKDSLQNTFHDMKVNTGAATTDDTETVK